MQREARQHIPALLGVLALVALALLLYHSLAGGTLLQTSEYNSYALQAQNWLEGRDYIADGENYEWLELAIYNGRYYQSFPPVPALIMLPFVAAAGDWQAIPGNLIAAVLALICASGVYLACMRRGMKPACCACLTLFVSLGSNLFWMSTSDGVWFLAQLCGMLFVVWGLFFALGKTGADAAPASLSMALAVGCRPFYALFLACWLIWRLRKSHTLAKMIPAVAPAAAVALCLMAYNCARFGNPLEFGHNYLPEFTRSAEGQFSLSYLWGNIKKLLRPVTLDAQARLVFEKFNGFMFVIANPLFLLAILRGLWVCLPAGKTRGSDDLPLPSSGIFILSVCILLTLATCMHRTLGGWQFGARYMVDLFVWLLVWFMRRRDWTPGAGAWTLCGAAVLFNLYGAVYMLSN